MLIMRYSGGFDSKTVQAFSYSLDMYLEVRLHLANCIVNLRFYFVHGFSGQGSISSRPGAY